MGASYLARPHQCSAAGPGPMFPAKGFPPTSPERKYDGKGTPAVGAL